MGFGTVIWLVVLMSAPVAAALFVSAWEKLDELGMSGLAIEDVPVRPAPRPLPRPPTPLAAAERESEIRQMVQARHDRQVRRGQPAVDVDSEVARLLALDPGDAPDAAACRDEALREEVRGLVMARNDRRARRGQATLDVEAEVERQILSLGGALPGRRDPV
jgi:hypothetical protein